ncbi:pb-reticulocyte binding protein, putative [Babesia ovata]|uniref:Pb-reticulocyte binding protein, putative n=1 Tax=Babesia ovata TaxID=189622 RepID=A0A2H6K9C3_9APIC|nr:pb-reticulocyte binding protein, putative [Babesia ovata]GBE59596.1 pb-reticulocyte binding protein, putative [Babesia ovata]
MARYQAEAQRPEKDARTEEEAAKTTPTGHCNHSKLCALLCAVTKPLRGLFVDHEHEEENVSAGKRDKKRRSERNVFSRRFITWACVFGSLILSLFIAGSLKIFGLLPAPKLPGFTYLNVSNISQLKDAMAQSGPRLVYCSNVKLTPEQNRVASLAVKAVPSWINKFAMDCSAVLPSGKTGYQRFEVDPATTVMFVQAHGKKALAITNYLIGNPQYFLQTVVNTAAHTVRRVDNADNFNTRLGTRANRVLLVVTDDRKFGVYSEEHTTALSRIIDINRLYGYSTLIVNTTIFDLAFDEDDDVPLGDGFGMYCLIPYEESFLLGYYVGAPFGKAMEPFMRLCATVSQR